MFAFGLDIHIKLYFPIINTHAYRQLKNWPQQNQNQGCRNIINPGVYFVANHVL